jgi:hypothetical protein
VWISIEWGDAQKGLCKRGRDFFPLRPACVEYAAFSSELAGAPHVQYCILAE